MKWPGHRAPLALLLAMFAAFAGPCGLHALGQDLEGLDEPPPDEARAEFSPEVEAKLAELFKKAAEAKRKQFGVVMKGEIEDLCKVTGLSAESAKALEAPSAKAADDCIDGWTTTMKSAFRLNIPAQGEDQIVQMLDQILPQVDLYAQQDFIGDYPHPQDNEGWLQAVKQTLTPEQATTWAKVKADRVAVLEKEIGVFLKRTLEGNRERQTREYIAKAADLKVRLTLDKERAEKLDALAKRAGDKSTEDCRVRTERMLLSMDATQRSQIMKNGEFYMGADPKDLPGQKAFWKEGLAAILTPEELTRLDKLQDEHKTRRVRVMGRILIAQLDEKCAFTGEQREKLQPIAERLVAAQPALFPPGGDQVGRNFAVQSLFAAGLKATGEEMKAILDDMQWKHWQEACDPKNVPGRMPVSIKPDAGTNSPPTGSEPEALEAAISDFLFEKATTERKRILGAMILKVEDLVRVLQPVADISARLQTASRGAAEEVLAAWKTNMESTVRMQIRDATPQNIRQRLASIEEYNFRRAVGQDGEKQDMWEKTAGTVLTDPQRTVWQKALAERNAFRAQAVSAAIMAEFDRKSFLTEDQWKKLGTVVAGIVKDYEPDITRMFSSSNATPWYLQNYMMFIPLAGIPEKDFKSILTPEQWDRWSGSNEFGNSVSYWENVQQYHTQRVKKQ
jgi:hypothetical protein